MKRDGNDDDSGVKGNTKTCLLMNLHDALRVRETHGVARTLSKKRRNTTSKRITELDEDDSRTTDEDDDDVDDDDEKEDRRTERRRKRPTRADERRASCSPSSSAKTSLDNFVERDSLKRFAARYCELLPNPRSTIANAYSCDGKRVASTHGDHTVKIIDVSSGTCVKVLAGHRRTPWVVRFHPSNPNILASGSLDDTVRVWDISGNDEDGRSESGSGKCIAVRDFNKPIASIAFSLDGGCVLVASGHRLTYWRYPEYQLRLQLQQQQQQQMMILKTTMKEGDDGTTTADDEKNEEKAVGAKRTIQTTTTTTSRNNGEDEDDSRKTVKGREKKKKRSRRERTRRRRRRESSKSGKTMERRRKAPAP